MPAAKALAQSPVRTATAVVEPMMSASLPSATSRSAMKRPLTETPPSDARSTTRPSATSRITVMRFSVIVPVLSEQITDADPSVSTEDSFFTIARRRAIR